MQTYKMTGVSKSKVESTYEVDADSVDQAIDKVLDGIAFDVDVIHLDEEVFYL